MVTSQPRPTADPRRPTVSPPAADGASCATDDRPRVLIADGPMIYRQGLRMALVERGCRVVGGANCVDQAIDLARKVTPDVVIVDADLPRPNGIELTRAVRLYLPGTAVILIAEWDHDDCLFQAIKAGAAAYFTKNVEPEVLVEAIHRVTNGEYPINDLVMVRPLVAARILAQFREISGEAAHDALLFAPLSAREFEVLDQIARGNSNKLIARALNISDQTVKNHITSILRKLVVDDRTQAVVYALKKGLLKLERLDVASEPGGVSLRRH